jgi:DNA replication protein DnaC
MVTTPNEPPAGPPGDIQRRLLTLGFWGLLTNWDEVRSAPWLETLLAYEEAERARRSLERRQRNARIGTFKLMADFDWAWPHQIDREAIDDALTTHFIDEGVNIVLYGGNGVGKSMIEQNIAYQALLRGYSVRFTTASDMLADLAAQDSTSSLNRRVARYANPSLLCIDEVGYLSYDSRYADLLFEVVTRRYQTKKPIVLSTNKRFADWPQVFPNAACVVTLVDRLLHRCECIEIEAESYRLKEAQEREAARSKARATRRKKSPGRFAAGPTQVPLPGKGTAP